MAIPKDIKKVIATVVAAECRLKYAAEILGCQESEIMLALVSDTASLSDQLRTSMITKLFETLMMTQTVFQAQLSELAPEAIARSYTAQLTAFAALTNKPTEIDENAPTSILEARQQLIDKLGNYADRADSKVDTDAASS